MAPLAPERPRADLTTIYEAVWRNMERENALVNFRLTWSILLSGGVLTAQALAIGQALALPGPNGPNGPKALIFMLATVLSCCALWFCRESGKGVAGALSQIDHLRRHYLTYAAEFAALGLPRPFGDEADEKRGHEAARAFPIALAVFWTVVLVGDLAGVSYCLTRVWAEAR